MFIPTGSINRRFFICTIIIIISILIQGGSMFWITSKENALYKEIAITRDESNYIAQARYQNSFLLNTISTSISEETPEILEIELNKCPFGIWLERLDMERYAQIDIDNLIATYDELLKSVTNIHELLVNNEPSLAMTEFISNTSHISKNIDNSINQLEEISQTIVSSLQQQINTFRSYKVGILLLLTVTVILTAIFITRSLNKTIIKPILKISEAMKNVEKGELNLKIPTTNNDDEIGYLVHNFNSMLEMFKLEKISQNVLRYLASDCDKELMLQKIAEELAKIDENTSTAIYTYDEKQNLLILNSGFLFPSKIEEQFKLGQDIVGQTATSGKPLVIDSPDENWSITVKQTKIKMAELASIPIMYHDSLLGVMIIGSPKKFTTRQLDTFKRIASQLGIALNNIKNYSAIQALVKTLKEKNNDLIKQKKFAEAVLRSSAEGIFSIDNNCKIQSWSFGAERITGYTASEAIGKKCYELFVHSDTTGSLLCDTERCYASRLVKDGKFIHGEELILKTKDGIQLPCLISASPIIDEKNNILGAVEIFRDISEDKANLQKIEQANKAKNEFLATMSHELRTPLNSILGFSELLENQVAGELNEKQSRYVQNIIYSGNHLLSLINDILDISKIESGKMDWEYENYNLASMLNNSIIMIKERASKMGINLISKIDEAGLENITGDKRKTQQIVYNLLTNAIKFTQKGGTVELNAYQENDHIIIKVWDTGIGIPEHKQKIIFEPFVQLDNFLNRKYEGAGLGLNLVKKLVELGDGTISVESEVDKGSIFTVKFPII